VVERNKPDDTFGWSVVFSDQAMDNMRRCDPVTAAQVAQAFNHWDDIALHFKGKVYRSGGHGVVGVGWVDVLRLQRLKLSSAATLATLMVGVPISGRAPASSKSQAATMPQNSLPWVSALISTCGPGWPLLKRCT